LVLATAGDHEGITRYDVLAGWILGHGVGAGEDAVVEDLAAGVLPDGRRLFVGASDDGLVHRIDAATRDAVGEPLRGLEGQALPDGVVMVAAGGEDQTILRWNAITGEPIGVPLTGPGYQVMRLAFQSLPDGRVLLVSVDDAAEPHRWEAVTGEPAGDPFPTVGDVAEVVAGPGGPAQYVTAGHDETVRRWDLTNGHLLQEVPHALCGVVITLANGRARFAVSGTDGTITVTPLLPAT
jgi:WD40 repeat protein